jgi:hypothetical protein
MVSILACRGRDVRRTDERIDLDQKVTVAPKPQDVIFVDFQKNWRRFISPSAELARPVVHRPEPGPKEERWAPIVTPECVFSADAGGRVPQVTLVWDEPFSTREIRAKVAQEGPAGQASPADIPGVRFDLALHRDGFGRNYYTAILAPEKLQRFKLPSNSDLINDTEAVLLTGPGLFPKLMDFRAEMLEDHATRQVFSQLTLVLRDLSDGLTYTIRMDRAGASVWNEEKRFTFLTPICPQSF